jgi:hypothetical protein
MEIREIRSDDEPRLREIFAAQHFDYEFPKLDSPEFLATVVICDDQSRPVMAVAARRTVELFLLADPKWGTPRWRLEALQITHNAMRSKLKQIGVQDAHIWVPPDICKSFGRRLMRMFGWKRQLWPSFSREV